MRKKISDKIACANELLKKKSVSKEELSDLKRWLGYFQHERLIHLIVTVFTGLCEMISIIVLLLSTNYAAVALTALIGILFIFYIIHYYILENGVQKLYGLIDALGEKIM
ncbi:MAG: hypothetical protein LBP40_05625 [Campylobacteraceae bacterium]|jgi:hypothetical protein|nr:hypothetical protein [Campylobacteraceae bacterium]